MNKITANIINSLLAGGLVLLGACTDGVPTFEGFFIAFIAAGIVAITQFKDFWNMEEIKKCKKSQVKLLNLLNL